MIRRSASRLFAITSRLLLVASLLFATGPWAAVLASTQAGDCQHMMGQMQHGVGNGHDCCADRDADPGMPGCGKHASPCSGICNAVCGLSCTGTVPAAMAFIGLPMTTAAPLLRSGVYSPSLFASPALRPPISL